jgi:hypothetical protein
MIVVSVNVGVHNIYYVKDKATNLSIMTHAFKLMVNYGKKRILAPFEGVYILTVSFLKLVYMPFLMRK